MSDTSQPLSSSRYLRAVGPFIFAATLVLYIATASTVPYPGLSASLIAQHLGLDPFTPVSHWLWGAICRTLTMLPFGSIAHVLNLFSALCGAAAVGLLYRIVSNIEHNRTFDESMARFNAPFVQALSGAFAALLLATCVPFWLVSTRAHPAPFDTLLLLLAFHLLMTFAKSGRLTHACLSAFVYGLGVTELATMIVLAPLYGLMMLYMLWRTQRLNTRVIATILACGVVGLTPYLACALQNWWSPSHEWRALDSFIRVLRLVWHDQYEAIARGMPRVGWILIMLVTVVPWLSILGVMPRGRSSDSRGVWQGNYVLSLVLSGLAAAMVLNVSVSPWKLTADRPLLVTPYVIIAIWAGYLAGYWYVIFTKKSRSEGSVLRQSRQVLRWILVPSLAVLVVYSAIKNRPTVSVSAAAQVHRFAGRIVDALKGRTWLVSNGIFDDNILLAAHDRGVKLNILNAQLGSSAGYLRYVASLFDNARIKGLARVGLSPLLGEWWTATPGVENDVSVLANADLLYTSNLEPLPYLVTFLAVTNGAPVDADALMVEHRAVWKDLGLGLKEAKIKPGLAKPWCDYAALQISKVANNFGVFLEDHGRADLAIEAYREARLIETNNLSALLNMHALARREALPEAQQLDEELQAFMQSLKGKYRLWSLSYNYGYVRYPEAYASRGWAWAMSGKPNMAINELRRALEVGGENTGVSLTLASVYFAQDLTDKSEAIYLSILEKTPDDASAILGMARIATSKGDFDAARSYLGRLHNLPVNQNIVRLEEAIVDGISGNGAAAIKTLKDLTSNSPDNMRAWSFLAILAAQEGDKATLDSCLERLDTERTRSPQVMLTVAHIAMANNDLPQARKFFERYLRYRPTDKSAMEQLLKLDLQGGTRDAMEEHVQRLLELDPRNPLGNLVLGYLQSFRKEFSLAEASLRVSLESWRDPIVLNELAWLLASRGEYVESLALIKESLAASQKIGAAWDTLGYIYLQTGVLDEAEKALQKAMELKPDNAEVVLHMAVLLEKKGMNKEALRLAEGLLTRPSELPPESYDEVRGLVKRLRAST